MIDDAIVYQCTATDYMIVVNASMGGPIAAHLRQEQDGQPGAVINDHTDKVGKMDLQGPAAARILGRILKDPATVFERMVYFSFKGSFDSATPARRTGDPARRHAADGVAHRLYR